MTNRALLALVAGALSVSVATLSLNASADSSARLSGGRAIAHRDGKVVHASSVPIVKTFSVGGLAKEPTLGVDNDGNIFYAAAGWNQYNLAGTSVLRSRNGGEGWTDTTPRVLGRDAHPVTLDPYVYVDVIGKKERVFNIDLTVACSYMSFSDDDGETWTTNPLACGRPVNDHQTLFSGPPVSSSTIGYPHILYYCWSDIGSSSCSKSIDGGISFHPTGPPAFQGYDPGSQDPGLKGANGVCGGLHGHGVVAPNGTVFLPREYCGKPMLAISQDEGRSWKRVVVSDIRNVSQPTEGATHPSVAVDEKGNVYYVWIASANRQPFMSVSKNNGNTWSKAFPIGPPGLKETNLPQIDARGRGKVAIVYYGSENSPFPKCADACSETDYRNTTWNGYMTISANALDKNPTFYTGVVNDPSDPLVRNQCGPGRCRDWVLDFIDVEIGPDGMPYGAYVDGCMPAPAPDAAGCTPANPDAEAHEGLMTKLVGGPSLK